VLVNEGMVQLQLPKDYQKKTHFFNPKMELTRDLSVLILNVLDSGDWNVCDLLAATGARGVRIAKECDVKEVWINDVSKDTLPFMEKNVELNKLSGKVKVFNKDAEDLFSGKKFNHIDIDPFGSPTYHFETSAEAIKENGLIGFAATDTAPLSGTYPKTCLKRYGIKSFKTDFFKELGLRILLTNAMMNFSKHNKTIEPLVCYAKEHYFRVWGKVVKGKVSNLKYVNFCPSCLWRRIGKKIKKCEFCGKETVSIGKIWVGDIENVSFLDQCLEKLSELDWLRTNKTIYTLLQSLKTENVPFYYNIHKVCKIHRLKVPKFKLLEEQLNKNGFSANRTHFNDKAIKTGASLVDLLKIVKKLS